MKKCFKVASMLCLLVCCFSFFSACDLSHKHYLDSYGVCRNCKTDTAELITRNANLEYVSTEKQFNLVETYAFFKFVANGETAVKIVVSTISTNYNDLVLLDDGARSQFLTAKGNNTYLCNTTLVQGKTYYIRLKPAQSGKIKVVVSPYISDLE